MKKLKIFLIALLATVLSVGLIACRKKDDTNTDNPGSNPGNTDTKTINAINSVQKTELEITDADTLETFTTKFKSAIGIKVRYESGGWVDYDINDCTIDSSSVTFGTVGNYTVNVKPNVDNSGNKSVDISVNVVHNFDENGICTVDKATRISQTIDVGLRYKLFHTGDAIYTAADDTSKNAIRPFGSIMVDGKEEKVKTYTVGRLEKGMSITVKGTAETTFDQEGVEDLHYYFPILGFADTSIGSYTGGAGTAIIVRNEGWVLLDGIGTPRLLAGKAAGGGGANDSGNYGSHPTDEGEKPAGYYAHGNGMPSLDQWKDWFTYSTGAISRSDTYMDPQEMELTWTYLNNGIIELVFNNLTSKVSLIARTKVPDSSLGYYDTILHGEYVDMKFTEMTTIQTTTLTGVVYDGIKSDARKVYLDNEMLDMSAFNVKITTEQQAAAAADTQFDIEANIGTTEAPEWVSLRKTPLDAATMKAFRVTRTMGNVTKTADIPADQFITIKTNAVDRATPFTVTVGDVMFANNSTVSDIVLSTEVSGADAVAKLTLSGRANTLSEAQKNALTGVTANKYVALRLWAREGASAQFAGTPVVKSGANALAGAHASIAASGKYVDLVIPVDASVVANGVTVSGIAEGGVDVKLDLSGMESVSVTSNVQKGTFALNKGGDVTVIYTMSAAEFANVTDRSRLYVNGTSARFSALSDTPETGYDYTGMVGTTKVSVKLDSAANTVTVKYTLPAFSVGGDEKFDLTLQDKDNNILATDTVYYNFEFAAETGTEIVDNVLVKADGTTLTFMIAQEDVNLTSETLLNSELMLNMNDGTKEGLHYLNLGYTFKKGEIEFLNVLPEGLVTPTVIALGTIDNGDDSDLGIIILLAVDVTKLGYEEAPYFFEFKTESAESEAPEYIFAVNDKAIERKAVTVGDKTNLGEAGSCLDRGYTGYLVTVDEKQFFAGVSVSGGMHKFEKGYCVVCGSAQTEIDAPTTWWDDRYTFTMKNGEYVDIIGTYSSLGSECGGNSTSTMNAYGILVTDTGTANYVMNGEGYYEKASGGSDGWGTRIGPASSVEGYVNTNATEENDGSEMSSSLITAEHPYNTLNGWIAADGKEIDAETFNKARIGGTFRYVLTYVDNVLTVNMKLYKAGVNITSGTAYIDFTFTLNIEFAENDNISLNGMAGFTYKNTEISVLKGDVANLHHTHEFGANDRCTLCGMLKPEHVHDFTNHGICICGDVCKHEHVTDNICDTCKGVWTETTTPVENAKYENPTVWQTWHDIPVGLAVGQTLTVTGTQKGEVASNWFTVLWEIKEGFTGRLDAFGWSFPENDSNFKATYSAKPSFFDKDGNVATFEWAKFVNVAKDCEWTVHFERNDTKDVNVQVRLTNAEFGTYVCDYVISLAVPQEELHVHFTAEQVAEFTVTSYTQGGWQYTVAE